jgi:hypothetical protein
MAKPNLPPLTMSFEIKLPMKNELNVHNIDSIVVGQNGIMKISIYTSFLVEPYYAQLKIKQQLPDKRIIYRYYEYLYFLSGIGLEDPRCESLMHMTRLNDNEYIIPVTQ